MPGLTPVAHPSLSGTPYGYAPNISSPGTPADRSATVARLVIIGALVVILVACVILVQQLWPSNAVVLNESTHDTQVKVAKIGSLTLDSSPQGAIIYLEDAPMLLPDGTAARTPSDLTSLQYGRSYRLKLVKEGYEPFEDAVLIDQATDGRHIQPVLKAQPGTLTVRVKTQPVDQPVQITVNGVPVALGLNHQVTQPGNSTVLVQGKAEGLVCKTQPESARIEPRRDTVVEVSCTRPSGSAAGPQNAGIDTGTGAGSGDTNPRRGTPRRTTRGQAKPNSQAQDRQERAGQGSQSDPSQSRGGCSTRSDVPPGYLTIDSTPYSEIFWNGRKIGSTPLANFKMPSGCVTIEAVNADQGKRKTVHLAIEPNRVNTYRIRLDGSEN